MARANTIQTNFTAGEISPIVKGRVDIVRYQNGVQTLKNFIVKPQGGIFARPGTVYITEVNDSTRQSRLVEFEYSETENYLLEFAQGAIRVIKNNALVYSGGSPVVVATPYQEADLQYLSFTQSADVLYICHPAYQTRTLTRFSDTNWVLSLFESLDGPYLSTNDTDKTMRAKITSDSATIKTTADSFGPGDVGKYVEYTQLGIPRLALITAYIDARTVTVQPKDNVVAPLDPVAILTYSAPNVDSTHAIFSSTIVGSYLRISAGDWHLITAYNSETQVAVDPALTMAATAGDVNFGDRSILGTVTASDDMFVNTDVGRHIRLNFSAQQVWGIITAFTDTKNVNVEFDRAIPLKDRDATKLIDDGLTALWRLGAWGNTTGWPSCVCFHEERLVFAASPLEPQTFWMSKSGDYVNFAPTDLESKVLDDNAITFTIASKKVNAIRWLDSGPTLIMGTIGGEWQISASSLKEAITPTNINVQQHTSYGSGHIRPVRIGPAVLFIQKSGRKVREISYDYQLDALVSKDITIISEHLLRRGNSAREVAYQQEPNSTYWIALQDGGLVGLTYIKDQEVYAWHYHEIGGSYSTGKAVVESVASFPSPLGFDDILYMIVKRTINGVTRRYIEYMSFTYDPTNTSDTTALYYVDCGVRYIGPPTNGVGASHLPGQTVQVLANGSVRPDVVLNGVGGGTFQGSPASAYAAGLKFESVMQTLPPEAGGDAGTAQGKTKRVHRVKARVYKSMGFKYGPALDKLRMYNFRQTDDPMDSPPPLRSADVPLSMDNSYDYEGTYYIVRDQPYPLNILAVMTELVTNES